MFVISSLLLHVDESLHSILHGTQAGVCAHALGVVIGLVRLELVRKAVMALLHLVHLAKCIGIARSADLPHFVWRPALAQAVTRRIEPAVAVAQTVAQFGRFDVVALAHEVPAILSNYDHLHAVGHAVPAGFGGLLFHEHDHLALFGVRKLGELLCIIAQLFHL